MTSEPLRDRRILAIEDEYYLAMDLERDLRADGAIVLGPVPSVAQAIEMIGREPMIDAAILDLNLGGEMAHPVAKTLAGRGIPFLFTTGYSDGDLDLRYPGIMRCEKPVAFAELKRALTQLLQA